LPTRESIACRPSPDYPDYWIRWRSATIANYSSKVLLLFGVCLLGLASWEYFPSASDQRVTVDEPDRTVQVEKAGTPTEVVFRVHNPNRSPVRVVGLSQC
jgi:uncharacterized protein (DUF58 family)